MHLLQYSGHTTSIALRHLPLTYCSYSSVLKRKRKKQHHTKIQNAHCLLGNLRLQRSHESTAKGVHQIGIGWIRALLCMKYFVLMVMCSYILSSSWDTHDQSQWQKFRMCSVLVDSDWSKQYDHGKTERHSGISHQESYLEEHFAAAIIFSYKNI